MRQPCVNIVLFVEFEKVLTSQIEKFDYIIKQKWKHYLC